MYKTQLDWSRSIISPTERKEGKNKAYYLVATHSSNKHVAVLWSWCKKNSIYKTF